jgi:hypothetical protein
MCFKDLDLSFEEELEKLEGLFAQHEIMDIKNVEKKFKKFAKHWLATTKSRLIGRGPAGVS